MTGNCIRCGGTGQTVYRHVDDGVCYACDGTGSVDPSDATKTTPVRRPMDCAEYLRSLYVAARSHVTQDCGDWWQSPDEDDGGILMGLGTSLATVPPEMARKARRAFAALGCRKALDRADECRRCYESTASGRPACGSCLTCAGRRGVSHAA